MLVVKRLQPSSLPTIDISNRKEKGSANRPNHSLGEFLDKFNLIISFAWRTRAIGVIVIIGEEHQLESSGAELVPAELH